MKPYQILMALALMGTTALLMFGDSSSDSPIAEAVQRPRATPVARAEVTGGTAASIRASNAPAEAAILRLIPRAALVEVSGEASFAAGEGIFRGQNWNPPPPPSSSAPPSPPMAPPLPFTVIGKALADGAWEVYLSRGDKTYVAHPQSIIDGSYRVEKITPPTMLITYLPLNQVQQMNIGALD